MISHRGDPMNVSLTLFPPLDAHAVLEGSGKLLSATLTWQPPSANAEDVGGYHVDRTTWWPGRPSETRRLTTQPVSSCRYVDANVKPDFINEYRVTATHKLGKLKEK
jgi:hypothetical protein